MGRVAILSVICISLLTVVSIDRAEAQGSDPTPPPVVVDDVDSPVGDIIPQPNSGSPPVDPGDRGGVLQLILLGLIVGFMAIGFFSVRRSMKRARALPTQQA